MTRMVPRSFWKAWTFHLTIGLFLLFSPIAQARPLSLGAISNSPSHEIKKLQALAHYLESKLQAGGVDKVKVIVARNIPAMGAILKEGKVDLYLGSPFSAVAVGRLSGSKAVLKAWEEGAEKHFSVIFVRKDTPFKRLRDLKGAMIAFEESFSTFGYWLPKMLLMEKGIPLRLKKKASDSVRPDVVGYVFSNDDENTLLWVKKGKVKAGAVNQLNYKKDDENLKILDKTISLPPQILSVRAGLPSQLTQQIKDIFKQMDRSEEGRKILQDLDQTTKFEDISHQSLENLLKPGSRIEAELKRR